MEMIPVRSQVWLRQDLCSVLNSIDKANSCIGDSVNSREVALFRAGFRAGLESVAVAIDVPMAPAHRRIVSLKITGER